MNKYTPSDIEKKWQDFWDEHESFVCENNSEKEKFYALVEFPYPSGQGLHVGHPRPYTALDIVSRMKRMQGYNVLYPMGWDAFGLPTENYAIKNKIHPAIVTKNNIAHFKKQLKSIGFPLTGLEKLTQLTLNIISGHNGFSYNFIKKDLLTRRKCQ